MPSELSICSEKVDFFLLWPTSFRCVKCWEKFYEFDHLAPRANRIDLVASVIWDGHQRRFVLASLFHQLLFSPLWTQLSWRFQALLPLYEVARSWKSVPVNLFFQGPSFLTVFQLWNLNLQLTPEAFITIPTFRRKITCNPGRKRIPSSYHWGCSLIHEDRLAKLC